MGKFRSPWKNGTTIAIIVFIFLFLFVLSKESKGATRFNLSAGATFVGGEYYDSENLSFEEVFNDKYEVGIMLQLRLDCKEGNPCKRGELTSANQAIYLGRLVKYKDFEMLFGMSYWHNQTPSWNSNTPYVLGVGYRIDNFLINYKHFSTGGSSSNNGGMDFISVGYEF
jgi:hypothetical protein